MSFCRVIWWEHESLTTPYSIVDCSRTVLVARAQAHTPPRVQKHEHCVTHQLPPPAFIYHHTNQDSLLHTEHGGVTIVSTTNEYTDNKNHVWALVVRYLIGTDILAICWAYPRHDNDICYFICNVIYSKWWERDILSSKGGVDFVCKNLLGPLPGYFPSPACWPALWRGAQWSPLTGSTVILVGQPFDGEHSDPLCHSTGSTVIPPDGEHSDPV
jgi:hypothetical protein